MPKFIAVHTLPTPMTPAEITPLVKQLLKHETHDAYWVESWAQMDANGKAVKIFCEWNGKTADAVNAVFAGVPTFPLDGVFPMGKFDSEGFRQA
jgi:hypothetical protein